MALWVLLYYSPYKQPLLVILEMVGGPVQQHLEGRHTFPLLSVKTSGERYQIMLDSLQNVYQRRCLWESKIVDPYRDTENR